MSSIVDNQRCCCLACTERETLTRDLNLRAGQDGIVSPTQLLRDGARLRAEPGRK